jgi:hypothetical protein
MSAQALWEEQHPREGGGKAKSRDEMLNDLIGYDELMEDQDVDHMLLSEEDEKETMKNIESIIGNRKVIWFDKADLVAPLVHLPQNGQDEEQEQPEQEQLEQEEIAANLRRNLEILQDLGMIHKVQESETQAGFVETIDNPELTEKLQKHHAKKRERPKKKGRQEEEDYQVDEDQEEDEEDVDDELDSDDSDEVNPLTGRKNRRSSTKKKRDYDSDPRSEEPKKGKRKNKKLKDKEDLGAIQRHRPGMVESYSQLMNDVDLQQFLKKYGYDKLGVDSRYKKIKLCVAEYDINENQVIFIL